jgi:hypothetical protein
MGLRATLTLDYLRELGDSASDEVRVFAHELYGAEL